MGGMMKDIVRDAAVGGGGGGGGTWPCVWTSDNTPH